MSATPSCSSAYDYCVPEKECAGGRCNDDPARSSPRSASRRGFFPSGDCTTTTS
ncbi:MAG: hypothetical protein ACLUEK_16630 [Oscillospiraceae bacterium]